MYGPPVHYDCDVCDCSPCACRPDDPSPTASAPVELIERMRREIDGHKAYIAREVYKHRAPGADDQDCAAEIRLAERQAAIAVNYRDFRALVELLERLTAQPSGELIERLKVALEHEASAIIAETGGNADIFWNSERFARAALAAMSEGVDRYE